MTFPIDRVDHRRLPPDWQGEVLVCDIDRTYLDTRFSSLRGLLRVPLESARSKRAIPGMVAFLKEIRRGPGSASRHTPIHFVSASPAHLRSVLERKMLMDGVEQDGTTFKDWSQVLRRGRFSRLKEQLGFKLTALLTGRRHLPVGAREILVGDDLENDPLAFSLYADIIAGRTPLGRIQKELQRRGVARSDISGIIGLKASLPDVDGVSRILIRMERFADPQVFKSLAPLLVACRSPCQMAIIAWRDGLISRAGVQRVAHELSGAGMARKELRLQLDDLQSRGELGERLVLELEGALSLRS